jgi:hypothetical protein
VVCGITSDHDVSKSSRVSTKFTYDWIRRRKKYKSKQRLESGTRSTASGTPLGNVLDSKGLLVKGNKVRLIPKCRQIADDNDDDDITGRNERPRQFVHIMRWLERFRPSMNMSSASEAAASTYSSSPWSNMTISNSGKKSGASGSGSGSMSSPTTVGPSAN